jgi:uncharacterized protein (DUF1697 family)
MPRRNSYVALLRGINVGGKNLIPMAQLRECFERMGFSDVTTYIQSGNVLFWAAEVDESAVEERLAKAFDYHGRVVIMTGRRYRLQATTNPWPPPRA